MGVARDDGASIEYLTYWEVLGISNLKGYAKDFTIVQTLMTLSTRYPYMVIGWRSYYIDQEQNV